jgi:2-dehydro-3-deoxyphosphogluconate aldolase/(4S)-4-hydroxy-2-oxoglutarate aldolase
MAKFSRSQVASKMESGGLVPLFFHKDTKTGHKVLDACHAGGVRILEFTNRGDFAHEIFSDLVKYVRQEFPDMMIGAGSIVDAPTTALFLQSGADFIVSPILSEEMARICNRQNVLW